MRKRLTVRVCGFVCFAVASATLMGAAQSKDKAASSHAPSAKAKAKQRSVKAKRRSVIDYFYLLPSLGLGGYETVQEKRELLQPKNHPVIDLKNDYLLVHPDSSPAEQIAVFRARGKADLLAVSMPDYKSDYNFFALYRLRNGKLQDVTRQMLPVPVRINSFLYEVPRVGTTIRVFSFDLDTQSRRYAFRLQWRRGRFVKVH